MTVYFDSKTGNVRRFVEKLISIDPSIDAININDLVEMDQLIEKGHLVTYTTGSGNVPVTTAYFMERYHEHILTVSCSGNRNWGRNFAICAVILSAQFDKPIGHRFELSGLDNDISIFLNIIHSY
ncbi:MAG: class Ib ribonucleoside-diphosphate reductase assembly flavoprotein NrdI [Sphingobacterium sp.]|uniref:class Ib ribonucleoside-diphosphate reductase assembly flavoprotein NrdI n=1 Tax=Sphingobacterium sp. JB170 TaxID=1434842 RepID=UPI00097ED85C|nr:class Ib ribonucleoside-diphosphate reductase assembly flavoprotein NrdI [Sphingobacterium sp. JB170]SJN27076.1 Ribonucleotide reduction protein NrdI [Sphingobacterium sp. JB170]